MSEQGNGNEERYDIVIAGAGGAGLWLANAILARKLPLKVLLLDPDPKNSNDRTWCFWARDPNEADTVVSHRWNRFRITDGSFDREVELAPYDYRMVRGIDFYERSRSRIAESGTITWVRDRVLRLDDGEEAVVAHTEAGRVIRAKWAFDGRYEYGRLKPDTQRNVAVLQHFLGLVVRCSEPVFDPQKAHWFDFRVRRAQDFRFCYVLPTDQHTALVEYTAFTPELFPAAEYREAVEDFVRNTLGASDWEVVEEESGIIPMFSQSFPVRAGRRIRRIGTPAGRVKASTGFAFNRMRKDAEAIATSLERHGHPWDVPTPPGRFAAYDRMLLDIFANRQELTVPIFVRWFQRNPIQRMLAFLDEELPLPGCLALMASSPRLPFIRAWFRVRFRQRRRSLPLPQTAEVSG